jgi:aminoglycoside phosphotransferase (APT) family kinase protein
LTAFPMHENELTIDEHIVRRMLAEQFPQWAELPMERIASSGTVNAIFRLGAELAVRAPFMPGDAGVDREATWSPRLAPLLPVRVPRVLGVGTPTAEYPSPWLVVDWIPGETPAVGALADPERVTARLVDFIAALRAIDATGAPPGHRSGTLARDDDAVRAALADIHEADTEVLRDLWTRALETPPWQYPPVWVHADLLPSNVLVDATGDLVAVIDMVPGTGDPAAELLAAWALVPAQLRGEFRAALDVDDETWHRGQGWALLQASVALPYYREINPGMVRMAVHTLRELVADTRD